MDTENRPADRAAAPDQAVPDADALRDALRQVDDPELGIDIVSLGLVAAVRVLPGRIELDLIPTSPSCPMGEQLVDDAATALEAVVPSGCIVDVGLVDEPAWTPERMSAVARVRFGW